MAVATGGGDLQTAALPLYVQRLGQLLNISPLLDHIEKVFAGSDDENLKRCSGKPGSGVQQLWQERSAALDARVYNFSRVTEERKWVQDLLLSDSEDSESDLSEGEQVTLAMELHYRKRKRWKKRLRTDPKLWKFRYFSSGLLMDVDHYPEHVRTVDQLIASGEAGRKVAKEIAEDQKREEERRRQMEREKERYRLQLWAFIAKKEVPKMAKLFATARHNVTTNAKKVAQLCQREVKKLSQKSQRASKEVSVQPRARRLMREALMYWRRYERTEKEQRRKAEKEAVEQRKIDDEMREAKRQQRKLNFLITQTELYAHFMAKKLTGEEDSSGEILRQLEDAPLQRELQPGVVVDLENPGDYDSEAMKIKVLANVEAALLKQVATNKSFDRKKIAGDPSSGDLQESFDKEFSLATPVLYSESEMPQPAMFRGTLKVYQLKGMNWLANLYDQGINGILADEMGLGKTVQTISLLAHLSERQGTWGPFLVVAPASTLHNWQQECTKFVPRFKVLPYWGSPHERKIIRKYWSPNLLFKENSPFHILITSYQLVVQDVKYFHRVKWQYMILDEAQAIKSSSSLRWKVLLSFSCRNRLLLTGTPIQNTMQELWALLHFIMPTMFDSHEEFNEWFSRDIESHAEKRGGLDANQLSRLHMILKPFMLRRIKRDVEHEMAEKIEVHLSCELSTRQKRLYDGLRQRISMEDLLQTTHALSSQSQRESSLLNLVMQFRKVCNHPDLFERRDVVSPLFLPVPSPSLPRLLHHHIRHGNTHRHRTLTVSLGVHTAHHIHHSSLANSLSANEGVWSFLRLVGLCPQEMATVMLGHFTDRLRVLMSLISRAHILYRQRLWHSNTAHSRYQLVLWPDHRVSFAAVHDSPVLQDMVFTGPSCTVYTHTTHHLFPLKTTSQTGAELTEISSMVSGEDREMLSPCSTPRESRSTPGSLSNSPLASAARQREGKKKTGGLHGALRNGLTESPKCPSPCPASSSPSTPPFGKYKKNSITSSNSRTKLFSSPDKHTGKTSDSVTHNGHMDNGVDNTNDDEGVIDERPCNQSKDNEVLEGGKEDQSATVSACEEGRHLYCMPTHMPRFLLAYTPSVSYINCRCSPSVSCSCSPS
jgi:DNA helicase INO80